MAIETISRLLTNMQQQGLIHVQRRQVTLLDINQLRSLCNNLADADNALIFAQNNGAFQLSSLGAQPLLQ